ncbi:MAG: helix-turn-helix transcriptional regulator [Candidatus Phosphoribacter sp.]
MRSPSRQTTAVLQSLHARSGEWRHGYELCRELGLKAGTIYPILMRLAERGLVETSWETAPPSGRPPRHLYRIAPHGASVEPSLADAPHTAPTPTLGAARPVLGGAM